MISGRIDNVHRLVFISKVLRYFETTFNISIGGIIVQSGYFRVYGWRCQRMYKLTRGRTDVWMQMFNVIMLGSCG